MITSSSARRPLRHLPLVCFIVGISTGSALAQPAPRPGLDRPPTRPMRPYFEPTADGALIGRNFNALVRVSGTTILVAVPQGPDGPQGPLRIEFAGARPDAAVRGVDEQPGRVNYLLGSDRSTWRTGIPTYARGRTLDVYPGIDLEYYASERELEYDFIVRPGADTSRIRLQSNKAARPTSDGGLAFGNSVVTQRRPTAYQIVGREKVAVSARYGARRDGSIGIALGRYDRSHELVIDPLVLVSTRTFGGSGVDTVSDITALHDGSMLIVGTSQSTDLPTTPNVFKTANPATQCLLGDGTPTGQCTDGFIIRVTRMGELAFVTYFGGVTNDAIDWVAVDGAENIVIGGNTGRMPIRPETCQSNGSPCPYIAKLSSDGQRLIEGVAEWYSGVVDEDHAVSLEGALLTVDAFGGFSIYEKAFDGGVTRVYRSTINGQPKSLAIGPSGDFYLGGFTYDDPAGTPDAVVVRSDFSGVEKYVTRIAGSSGEFVGDIAVDDNGTAWVTGTTVSEDFPFTTDASVGSPDRPYRGFLAQIDASGAVVAVKPLGTPSTTMRTRLQLAADAVYAVGCGESICETVRVDRDGREDGPFVVPNATFAVDGQGRQAFVATVAGDVQVTTYRWQESARVRITGGPFPARVGAPITFTATGTGVPPFEYQWWLYDQATGWRIADPYGPHSTFSWTPTDSDVGTHAVQVWIRPANSTATLDSYDGSGYFDVVDVPVTAALTSNTTFPLAAGTPITWTASATGAIAPFEYQFWLYSASVNTWRIVQDYSPANTFAWTPSTPGDYGLQVNVRGAGTTRPFDTAVNANYPVRITAPPPVVVHALSADTSTTVTAGTPMTWTSAASGGAAPLQYRFIVYDHTAGSWSELRPYGPASTLVWTPMHAAVYSLQVWVRSAGSTAAYDAWTSSAPVDVSPSPMPAGLELRSDKPMPPPLGAPVAWTVTSAETATPVEYKFMIYRRYTGMWVTEGFKPLTQWTWSGTTSPDVYAMAVWARRQGSTADYEAWVGTGYFTLGYADFEHIALTADQSLPAPTNTPITWRAVAGDSGVPLEYQFWLYDRQASTWTITQPWSHSPAWTWTPGATDFGLHAVQVWIRSQGSAAAFDAYRGSGYFVIVP